MQKIGCPIVYFEDNIYYNSNKKAFAVYKMNSYSYAYKSVDEKKDIMFKLVNVIKEFSKCKILIIPTSENLDEHTKKIKNNLNENDILYNNAINHINGTTMYLESKSQAGWNNYSTYLIISLEELQINTMTMLASEISKFLKEPLYNLSAKIGLNITDIPEQYWREFVKYENELYKNLCRKMAFSRATTGEMQWLLWRINYRGINSPVPLYKEIDPNNGVGKAELWRCNCENGTARSLKAVKYIRPNSVQIAQIFEGILANNGIKGITVEHDSNTVSYQSFLAVTNIPRSYIFPGGEWIYMLATQPYPVEVCIDIENVHTKTAKETLENKNTEVTTQIEALEDAGGRRLPTELKDAYTQIPELQDFISKNNLPMSKVKITMCVFGDSEKIVEDRVKQLKAYFDTLSFRVTVPVADQLKLYYQHIPASESYANAFTHMLSPLVVASGIFGAENRVGDGVGMYVAASDGKPVYLHIGEASLKNKSPACMFIGDLGYGKSFNANLLLFLHILQGGYGLVICPKGERKHWKNMPYIGKYTNLVELAPNDENRGKLDPFNIYREDIEYAATLAQMVICELIGIKQDTPQYVVLMECLNRVKLQKRPSMTKLIEELGNMPKTDTHYASADILKRSLTAIMQSGYSRLIFGNGTEQGIQIDSRLNLIMLSGVTFPSADVKREDYTSEDKISMVLMLLISSFVRKFSLMHKNKFKITLVDESWALSQNSAGAAMIEWVARQGRSLYSSIILNGHSVDDIPSEKLLTTITYKFCFHTSERTQAIKMLEFLKIDTSEENINILMSLGNGQCLFSDATGRVGKISFDAVFEDIIEFFSTTPKPNTDDRDSTDNEDIKHKSINNLENNNIEREELKDYLRNFLEYLSNSIEIYQ